MAAKKIKMNKILFAIIISLIFSCSTKEEPKEYSQTVGDIKFDPDLDDPEFKRCDDYSVQYYYGNVGGFSYVEELGIIKSTIMNSFRSNGTKGQTGFYTIRFLVNCKGETGLFRSYSVDKNLKEFNFEHKISKQLLKAVKELKGWEIANYEGHSYDYYQYLTFQLLDGNLIDITP